MFDVIEKTQVEPYSREGFFEVFAASLVVKGRTRIRTDDPRVRQGLSHVRTALEGSLISQDEAFSGDADALRALFDPGAASHYPAFDEMLRSNLTHLTSFVDQHGREFAVTIPHGVAEIVAKVEIGQPGLMAALVKTFLAD